MKSSEFGMGVKLSESAEVISSRLWREFRDLFFERIGLFVRSLLGLLIVMLKSSTLIYLLFGLLLKLGLITRLSFLLSFLSGTAAGLRLSLLLEFLLGCGSLLSNSESCDFFYAGVPVLGTYYSRFF